MNCDDQQHSPIVNNVNVRVEQKAADAATAAALLNQLTEQALDNVIAKLEIDPPSNAIKGEGFVSIDHRLDQKYVMFICNINGTPEKFTIPFTANRIDQAIGQLQDKLAQTIAYTILRSSMDKMATELHRVCKSGR